MTTSARDSERARFVQRVNHHEGELKRAIIDLERFDEVSTLMEKAQKRTTADFDKFCLKPGQEAAQKENKDPRITWDIPPVAQQEQDVPEPEPAQDAPYRGGLAGAAFTYPIWTAEKKEMDEFIKPFHAIYGYNREFAKLLNEMARTHISKNRDYASDENHYSNFEYAEQVARPFKGIDAVFATIIGIKMARISELRKGKTPNNEPLRDSYKDLSVYVGLWTSYRRMEEDKDAKRGCDSPIKR